MSTESNPASPTVCPTEKYPETSTAKPMPGFRVTRTACSPQTSTARHIRHKLGLMQRDFACDMGGRRSQIGVMINTVASITRWLRGMITRVCINAEESPTCRPRRIAGTVMAQLNMRARTYNVTCASCVVAVGKKQTHKNKQTNYEKQ